MAPAQNWHLALKDLRTASVKLPLEQRKAVLFVAGLY